MNINEKIELLSSGIRIIYIIDRSNSNTNRNSSRWNLKIIVNNKEDFRKKLIECYNHKTPEARIYSSMNACNFMQAQHKFKQEFLTCEYLHPNDLFNFYKNIEYKWISALARSPIKKNKLWMID